MIIRTLCILFVLIFPTMQTLARADDIDDVLDYLIERRQNEVSRQDKESFGEQRARLKSEKGMDPLFVRPLTVPNSIEKTDADNQQKVEVVSKIDASTPTR